MYLSIQKPPYVLLATTIFNFQILFKTIKEINKNHSSQHLIWGGINFNLVTRLTLLSDNNT